MYMPALALAFDRGWLCVCQVIARKRDETGALPRSLTRDYQYLPEPPIRPGKGLDWSNL
jgi:hypothetical protein